MAHHGIDEGNEIAQRLFAERMGWLKQDAKELDLGPTGLFPEGKLIDGDEGEIRVGISNLNGKVVIHFGRPVTWIGFTSAQAREIAASLEEYASKVEAQEHG